MSDTKLDHLPFTLNAQQVAEVLGVAKNTAYTLMHSRDFPTIHIGRRMVVPKEKLLVWMEEQLQ